MNYEYSQDELTDYTKATLLQIARDYHLSISKNVDKKYIIGKILNYQSTHGQFNQLPIDIIRLLAFYLDICDIIHLCRLNKRLTSAICHNDRFIQELGHLRLTREDKRLKKRDIFRHVYFMSIMNDIHEAAHLGYLEAVKRIVNKLKKNNKNIDYLSYSFSQAAISGFFDIMDYLISLGYDPRDHSYLIIHDLLINSPNYDVQVLDYLVSKGVDIHEDNDDHFMEAVRSNNLEVVKYFIQHGSDIHAFNDRALIFAEEAADDYGDEKYRMLKYLLSLDEPENYNQELIERYREFLPKNR